MTQDALDSWIADVARSVIAASFDLSVDDLPEVIRQENVPGWTTESQTVLLLNLEDRFHVSFSLEQMVSMTSLERIVEVLRHMVAYPPGSPGGAGPGHLRLRAVEQVVQRPPHRQHLARRVPRPDF